jgi:hypothetical protein
MIYETWKTLGLNTRILKTSKEKVLKCEFITLTVIYSYIMLAYLHFSLMSLSSLICASL